MKEVQDKLQYLLEQYANGSASPSEENELFTLIDEAKNQDDIKSIMLNRMRAEEPAAFNKNQWQPVLNKILGKEEKETTVPAPVYNFSERKRAWEWKRIEMICKKIKTKLKVPHFFYRLLFVGFLLPSTVVAQTNTMPIEIRLKPLMNSLLALPVDPDVRTIILPNGFMVSSKDIKEMAKKYLTAKNFIQLILLPENLNA